MADGSTLKGTFSNKMTETKNPTNSSHSKTSFAMRLQFDDSVSSSVKRRKQFDIDASLAVAEKKRKETAENVQIPASPWEARRVRAELIEARALNAQLENRVSHLHALRKEMEVLYENEKATLLKQQSRDKETITALEDHMNTLRKRESECKEQFSKYRKSAEEAKFNLEKMVHKLQKENAILQDKLKQEEMSSIKSHSNAEQQVAKLESELALSVEEAKALRERAEALEKRLSEASNLKHKVEITEFQLSVAQRKIKELENEQEKGKEAMELVKNQQNNLKRLPGLERELVTLREETKNLREAVHNKLLLEEEVTDLRFRLKSLNEREEELLQLQVKHDLAKTTLEKWQHLARDHCGSVVSDKAVVEPDFLRTRIESLQQKELILTAEVAQLESRLKSEIQAHSSDAAELESLKKRLEKMQPINEQKDNLIRRLQKKIMLVSRERDSYRSQLDLYERELTVTSVAAAANSQQQQQRARIEALEKAVEGYRDMVERLEGEIEKNSNASVTEINEKVRKLEEERDKLLKEKEQLMKRKDELEIKLEQKALNAFDPTKSKVLHFRANPFAEEVAEKENAMKKLQETCDWLRERVRVLEEGQTEDVTQVVATRLSNNNAQELQELKEQVKTYETKIQRLKEAFRSTSQEYREVCYLLLGYKIDRINTNQYRLSHMYAESPDDYLLFQLLPDGNLSLIETEYSTSLEDFIDLHLRQQHSIPVFLSTVTIDLFNRQTLAITVTESAAAN